MGRNTIKLSKTPKKVLPRMKDLPYYNDYIANKLKRRGLIGKKRKTLTLKIKNNANDKL